MRPRINKKRAIADALFSLGLHTTPKAVVQALSEQGVQGTEELVRQVRIEMLKEISGARMSKTSRPVPPPTVRRCPQGFPGRQGKARSGEIPS